MKLIIGIFLIFPCLLFANPKLSAKRLRGEHFEFSRQKFISNKPGSAFAMAVPANQLNINKINQNYSVKQLAEGFKYVRDLQFLKDSKRKIVRRSTWLYPDDGCFARAALMEANLERLGFERPSKLFIFGNLFVRTPNSPDGFVEWWFHVVPVVKSGGKAFVFDPAVDPSKPLELSSWVALVAPSLSSTKISICDSHTYGPNDRCDVTNPDDDKDALKDQIGFLDEEWNRLIELRRTPEAELVNAPPW